MTTEPITPNPSSPLIRLLIVDDMPHVRRELRTRLQLTSDVEVVGEASDGAEAVAQAERLRPEVIVMDLEMPSMDGITATREIKRRGLARRIILLSVHPDPKAVKHAQEAGADALVDKTAHLQALIDLIVAKY